MTDKFEALNKDEVAILRAQELESKYRHILTSSDMGVDVLADILVSFCHFGTYLDSDYQMAQHNVGVKILSRCGVFAPGNMDNVVRTLVNSAAQPIKLEQGGD